MRSAVQEEEYEKRLADESETTHGAQTEHLLLVL